MGLTLKRRIFAYDFSKRSWRADHRALNDLEAMSKKMISRIRAALLIGATAGVCVLSTQAIAGMHSSSGHGSASSHGSMSAHGDMGMHGSMGFRGISAPPPNMGPPPSRSMSTTAVSHTMGDHDRDHDHDHDHHHHRRDFDDDFFFFDPFWWGYSDYPYAAEAQYAEEPVADGYWYYCPDSRSYYPYVQECASRWERVAPTPPPPPPE